MINEDKNSVKINWKTGFIYLTILAPLFFVLYNWANSYALLLPKNSINEIVYNWEKNIPFLPWTILPYWSIDLLYGLSLFLPMTKFAQRQHALRLLVATPIAVGFFYFFPMTFSTVKPEIHGIWKTLFEILTGFDKPYNQAPSLHIILLVIIWLIYLPHFEKTGKLLWNFWCFLIGISILTTFQHHFIDIPTGFLVGIFICYLFPLEKIYVLKRQNLKSKQLAIGYLGLGFLLITAGYFSNLLVALLFIWLGISLFFIGLGYLSFGAVIFQKNENGKFTVAARILYLPFRIIIKLIRYLFFNKFNTESKITNEISIGNFNQSKTTTANAIFDLCSEYERENYLIPNYKNYQLIDLAVPSLNELTFAVIELDTLIKEKDSVFVHCALGLSRSATVVLGWLLYSKNANSVQDAIDYFIKNNYKYHLSKAHKQLLETYFKSI